MLFSLAISSLLDRRVSALLTCLSICISVALLISVEHLREQARQSFNRTISGTDLIVGAPNGQINLLLHTVFRMGAGGKPVSWQSFEALSQDPKVKWAIPLSLGDSHKGFSVLGTTQAYFEHYQFGQKQALMFAQGVPFSDVEHAVLGSDVAQNLGYQLGDSFHLSHGMGKVSFSHHRDIEFVVSGILAPTGTPVDKTIHVSLAGIEAAHPKTSKSTSLKRPQQSEHHGHDHDEKNEHEEDSYDDELQAVTPEKISGFLLGLTSRIAVLQMQHKISNYQQEPLQAILPGVALAELWQLVGTVETVLRVISILILFSSLLGMATMLLASMRERNREMAVLRAVGAGPATLFILIQAEALLLAAVACVGAVLLVTVCMRFGAPLLAQHYGLFIDAGILNNNGFVVLGLVMLATSIISIIPAAGAYRRALHVSLAGQ